MEKNYISKRSIKNSLKIVLIAFVFFSNIGINSVYAQACPVLTGPVYSKPDDIVITTYHSSIALGNGKFLTWGEDMAPDGTNQTSITEINSVNAFPLAVNDTPADIVENTGLINIDVLSNDSFGNDGPNNGSITAITLNTGGAGSAFLNDNGTATDPTDDSIDFIPAFGYFGPVNIDYTITDADGDMVTATVTFNVIEGESIICGPINTLYQTVGNTTPGKTDIFRYNNFQQSYVKVGELGGTATDDSAPNSAYNAATQLVYSSEPSDGGSTVRVYDPATNYSHIGNINITGNSENFNNTLFAQGNFIGYVNNNKVIRFDVTNISSYPVSIAVNEVAITGAQGPADYSLIGDEIYGVTDTTLRVINLANNTLVDRAITFDNTLEGTPTSSGFGAVWQDRNGNLYFFNNGNGHIYKITNVVNPASTVAVKVLLASPSGKNDGFGCELGPDPLDWDDDGISNSVDIDDDNDGILDVNESNGSGIDPGGDDDNDGVFNFRDPDIAGYVDVNGDTINDNFDFDLDGVPDAFDLDSDNDGIPDNIEAQTTIGYVAPSGSDDDNDGLDNNYDSNDADITPAISIGLLVIDTDSASDPGSPDFLDVDADNDGIYDTVEAGLKLANADVDFDGLDDAVDSNLTNATDSNGTINDPTLLPDTNIGGDVDFREIADFDNDGVDNITDLDDDNDGILDTVEYPVGLTPFGDEDGDGIFNYADAIDNGTGDGSLTDYTNTNGDTIPDAYDFDLDGIVNHLDTDSDGDGCSDANEAYASSNADAGDGEQFGTSDPLTLGDGEVNADGTVAAAAYTAPENLDSAFGNTDADFLQLSIIPNVITLDPVDISTIPFANISFTSTASSTGTGTAVQYQWQEQVDGAGVWNDIVDDITTYSGATTTTLGITAVNSTLDGNLYRLQVYSPAYICDTDVFSAAALLTITENNITAINDNGSGIEGTASTVISNVLANDDLAGVTPTTATVILTEVSSTSAEVTLDTATGAVSVSAAATAGTYSIVYQICETASPTNCTTAEITVVVNDQGNPIAVNDAVLIAEGTTTSTLINAIGNDNTQDNTNYLIGSLVYSSGNGATITDNDNGTFGYIPAVGFSGTDTFTYTICDDDSPTASCDTATVTITVADTGNPIAVNDAVSIPEGITTSTLINAIGNDNLADNATYSLGSLNVTGTTGTVTDNNDGTFGYIPAVGFSGIDTFIYTICDDDATPTCDTATVTIIVVDSGNPIAVDDSVLIAEGTVLATSIDALANDTLADNATYNTGSLVYSSGNGVTVIYNGTSGEFEYTPAVGFSGTDTFTYTICDDDSPTASCDTATVTITVADTGNPIAVNDEISILEGTTTSTLINAIGNDNLADNATYSAGSLDVTGTTGTVTDNNDGTFGYIPAVGFSGIDTFTYTICDDDGTPTCDTATVTIIVVDSGNPIAVDDSILIAEGTVSITSIDALANDNLADNAIYNTGSLVYSSGNGATVIYNGTSGEFEYTPAVGFSGTDTFTYTICDDDATPTCDTATVTIIVVDSGNPIAVDDSVIINEDTTVATIINVLANDNLVDNAAYSAGSLDVTGTIGTVTDNGDGTFDYIPAAGFAGLDTFTYTICDDDAIPTCDKATVFITVLDEGNPFANNDSAITILNTVVTTGNVLTNDTVVDNATITSFDVTSAKGGTITDNGGGTFNYTPPFGFIGVDSFTYTLCDDDVATASCTTATVFVTVLAGTSNLITTKTVSNSTPDEGQTITYTLTVTNNGPNAASNVSLTDLLPNGVTYTGNIPSQGVYNPGSGIWTVGDIAFPGNATITIDSTVDANTSNDLITNTTTAATGDQSDPTTVGDDLVEAITVNNVADIVLTMVVDNNNPNVGDTVTYTVTVTNYGPAKVTSLVVTDVLPSGLTYGIVSPSDGTWAAPNWSVGILESGEEETIVIEAVVGMDQGGATLINVASNSQDQVDSNSTPDDASEIIVVTSSDLVTVKTVSNATPNEGDIIVYTIAVTNSGSDATGVSLTDLLPQGVTYVSDDQSGAYNSGSGIWTIGNILDGTTATLNITALVDVDTSGTTITNSTSAATGDQSDPTTDGDILEATIGVENFADIVLTKVVDNAKPNVGDIVTYTITVTNNGPSKVTNLVVTDTLPAGLTYANVMPSDGIWTAPNWQVDLLESGEFETIVIEAVVGMDQGGMTLTNIVSNTQDQVDSNLTEDDDRETIVVTSSDLVTVKTVSNATPNEGDTIIYTIAVTNNGPSIATNVSLIDNLPVGVTFVSHSAAEGTYNYGSGLWSIGNLANGATAMLNITATVDDGTLGQTITNTTSVVTADQSDSDTTNNVGTVSIVPTAYIDLSLTKSVVNDVVDPEVGDIITFEIRVNNDGPTEATGVQVKDLIPSGYDFVNYSSSIGTYNPITGLWNIGFIEIGNTAVLLVDVIVMDSGDYINCAEITAANELDIDSTPGNANSSEDDYDCASAPPYQELDLKVEKTIIANNLTPMVGTEVSFEIRLINDGIIEGTEVVVTDLLPTGYTFLNYSSTRGAYDDDSGKWMVGTIVDGETEVLVIDAIINATGDYLNCATITEMHQTDTDLSNNTSCIATDPIKVADLELTKEVELSDPNLGTVSTTGVLQPYAETNVDFTITLTNNGPSDATGVQVNDLLPNGYNFVSASTSIGSYDDGSGIWDVGTVLNGSSETLVITAYVNPLGDWVNIAEVIAVNELDLDSTPNNGDIFEDDMDQIATAPIVPLTVPEGFSPNGDGINDLFEIEFLQILYPNFGLEIVDRYGNLVYKYKHNGDPYQTPEWWDGFSSGKANFSSDQLPAGTYFYTIYFNNNERKPQTGWVYLRK
ncbi:MULTISPECIES: Ig-like domain-containing protein [Flavobacteriaceae]|uniref:DUF11 domain-containing protein n=2 Tax=Flavobacteriaceae TaxID=49546 RepID=A0A4Y8ARC2_9FLAO|nr:MULTISPECIES: Ig-like domain-containing protein [Flavobacteriaceae]TEW73733.1 DUF11 domain-containing protein [Gramella jeungdoensis]GGK37097.1 hypothetical protein GCM10007963_01490 [Lutibacter litoralis]